MKKKTGRTETTEGVEKTDKEQSQRFIETAQSHGLESEDPELFEKAVEKLKPDETTED